MLIYVRLINSRYMELDDCICEYLSISLIVILLIVVSVMQNISPFCLKSIHEYTNEMTFRDNLEYFSQNIDHLTKYNVFTTFFAYALILGVHKRIFLKGLSHQIYHFDTDITFI
jgi:hypothetical protein